ncbi:hypothetical protein B0H17DRAFT_1073025 [Mycena rosella]|uniref:DUF6533 domain-containing protein n=1 Tax=Mycena rosella TaxID=1033263 RepID=A0AAD7D987_MYCRO|nr:hypothetical protein B0H17DRAFT_1073025 [Mycena rosella]
MESGSPVPADAPNNNSEVIWASRALVSAAALYFYDFLLTFTNELELYHHSGQSRKLVWSFIPLRYLPALYQLLMIISFLMDPTLSRCATLDKISLGLDTSFQLSYVGIISWRVRVINGVWIAIPLALLGLSAPIINIAVANPSVFPQCRLLNTAPTARIITILPCLRAAFDAATTLALLGKIWRHIASMGALASNTVTFVLTEEIKDIVLIFAIMAMEAVFAQIPSARTHGRNYIVPFVDSLTAILATRFMFELEERGRDCKTGQPRTSRALTRDTTLVGTDGPAPACDDSSSSLHTFETRSIGWNRVGSCLGARAF